MSTTMSPCERVECGRYMLHESRTAADSRLVTLTLDGATTARLEAERRRFFPPERNRVPAHVMLFHRLPAEHDERIRADLRAVAEANASFVAAFGSPYSLGRGSAYPIDAPQLLAIRADLAMRWAPWLIAQDREGYRPHAVVQNKVTAETARATLERLRAAFVPFGATALGLSLWTYRPAGTWHDAVVFSFGER